MPTQASTVYKGTTNQVFEIDPSAMASNVRQQLENAHFVSPDTIGEALRFYIYGSRSTTFADAILSKDLETLVPVSGLFGLQNQLYLTNINAGNHPDLMGIGTTWFFDRYMSCTISLNTSDGGATVTNAGKFQPLMMTNVRPTSEKDAGIYDNVVVCEKGSVIAFTISSWGAIGYGFSIKPNAGQSIVDALYVTYGTPNQTAGSYTYRYQSAAQQIVVDSTESLQIPSGQTVQYQRVVVKTWRLTSYRMGDTTYSSDVQPPSLIPTLGLLTSAAVIPGKTVDPGAPHPGDNSNQTFGTIYDAQQDDPDANPLGEIVIYFFVFDSHEDAKLVVDQINSPNPTIWA